MNLKYFTLHGVTPNMVGGEPAQSLSIFVICFL